MSAINFIQLKREMEGAGGAVQRLEILSEFLDFHEQYFVLSPRAICSILQIFNEHGDGLFCHAALQVCLPYIIPPFTFANLTKVCKMFNFGQNVNVAVNDILSIFPMEQITAAQIRSITDMADSEFAKFLIIKSFVHNVPEISDEDHLQEIMRSDDMKREVRFLFEAGPQPANVQNIDIPVIDIIDSDDDEQPQVPALFEEPVFVPEEPAPPVPVRLPKRKFNLLDLEGNAEPSINENEQCILCCDNKKTVVFLPCLHLCCCVECARQLNRRECPYCRQRITKAHNSKPVE